MGKNGYLEKQKIRTDVYRQAEKDTCIQFMTDTLMVVLNDPEIMGKDVFGKKRITKVVKAWGEAYDKYHGALERGDEQDFWQVKLDMALGKIMGEDLIPFEKRYEWISQPGYEKRRR